MNGPVLLRRWHEWTQLLTDDINESFLIVQWHIWAFFPICFEESKKFKLTNKEKNHMYQINVFNTSINIYQEFVYSFHNFKDAAYVFCSFNGFTTLIQFGHFSIDTYDILFNSMIHFICAPLIHFIPWETTCVTLI